MKKFNKDIGNYGEDLATEYLINNNYKILSRNFRCRSGEIDIIAVKNLILCFIEVKSRFSKTYGLPMDSVNPKKQKKLFHLANYYIDKNNLYDHNCQFDVIEVFLNKEDNSNKINHLEDVFYFDNYF